MRLKSTLFLCISLGLVACGGSSKPAEEPTSEATKAPAADAAATPSSAEKAGAPAKKAEAKEEAPSEPPKPTRTPEDILTAPDVIFMFSWNSSDVKEQAEKQCDNVAKDDPKKRAQCLEKEKKKIEVDGMSFKQEKGRPYWFIIKRKGKVLVNLHKLPVEFGAQDDHSIVVKPVGKDEGTLRGGAPGETKIQVPSEYQIIIDDPKLGKTVYDAKIGLTGGN